MKVIFFAPLLLTHLAVALKPVPPTYMTLAQTTRGIVLRVERAPSPEGGSFISYQVVDKKLRVLKSFPVSDTQFDAHAPEGNVHGEKISDETCRSNLQNLQVEMKKWKFKKIQIHDEACSGNRQEAVSQK